VPTVFRAMVEQVRPTLQGGPKLLSWSLRYEIGEGDLAGTLVGVQAAFADVPMGSYPFVGATGIGSVLVLRHAERGRLEEAADALRAALAPLGAPVSEAPPE